MRISSIYAPQFRRFKELRIDGVPASAKLVVLVGPNGSGKSAVFDAVNMWYLRNSGGGISSDPLYFLHGMTKEAVNRMIDQTPSVSVQMHGRDLQPHSREMEGVVHIRSAYRHEADFTIQQLSRMGDDYGVPRLQRLIDADQTVSRNYQRLVMAIIDDVFDDSLRTNREIVEALIGRIQRSLTQIFPDLQLEQLSNPSLDGTFLFAKGEARRFHYKNLSAGEKAVFDLLLDLEVRTKRNPETVYLIDEPEVHTNAAVQRNLLSELVRMVPEQGQLWIATHSHGMLNAARKLEEADPGSVSFLSFFDRNLDEATVVHPALPNRNLWQRLLRDSLDDLADLVAPRRIVLCEGQFSKEYDATCYNQIFAEEFPDTLFVSMGSSSQLENGGVSVRNLILKIAAGTEVITLLDRDDMSPEEERRLPKDTRVLSRRELENYLLDEEILVSFCQKQGRENAIPDVLRMVHDCLVNVRSQANAAPDEVKAARGHIYNGLKDIVNLRNAGRNAEAFLRDQLAPLVLPGTNAYNELKDSIFRTPIRTLENS